MRVLPAAPEVPLAAPPAESFDLQDSLTCPACGCPDAAMQLIETVELAKCPQCQCEFPPRVESVSRQVIRRISEHRQRRMRRFMETLPVTSPVAGLNPVDYDLFRKIVGDIEQYDSPREHRAHREAMRHYQDEQRHE
jgi:threonine synthase